MKKTIIGICFVLLLLGCFEQNNVSEAEQNVAIQFAKPASIDVASAICKVSAEDMDTIRVVLTVTPTLISGTIPNIPYGDDRLFEIMCYNSSELMNYYGFSLIDINSLAPVVDIVLYQVDTFATVTINGRFGDTEETEEKIVFSADWSGSNDIYIMDIDGTNIRKLTSSIYNDNYPILSPNREKISFHRWADDGPIAYILDIETLELEQIGFEGYKAHCFYWHPSRDEFLFHSNYYGTADIFTYNVNTETIIPIIKNSATNWVPSYSQDGEKVLYYTRNSGIYKMWLADADGSDQTLLIPEGSGEERTPDMCPTDTNLIVFSGRGYGEVPSSSYGLFILNRSTGEIIDISSGGSYVEGWPRWTPDGEKIIYERISGSDHGIYVINRDGSQNKVLIDTERDELYPHWR